VAGETFRGEHYLKVDAKGRTMLPSPFRSVFQAQDNPTEGAGYRLLIVYGGSNRHYVEAFTQAGAAELDRRFDQLPYGSDEAELFSAIYHEQSVTVETDKDGRFSPPAQVREKLGFSGETELCFVGARDTIRIWRADTYREIRKAQIAAMEARLLGDGPNAADPRSLLKNTV
jgi:MraZ protein